MLRDTFIGIVAGAAGTIALDVSTYTDMAVRGRASSGTPAKLVSIVTDKAGISLASDPTNSKDETAQNRQSGIGALLGYVTGLGVGLAYGLIRSQLDEVSEPLAGIGVGLAAMAASDIPIMVSGASDPKSWSLSDWASDLIPHLIYGLVTVATYESLID